MSYRPGKVPRIESSSSRLWERSALASTFTSFSPPVSVSGIANEPRFGVPSITRRPPRPWPLGVVHGLPHVAVALDEPPRHEAAHRMGDEMHRVTAAERLNLAREPVGALVDVLPPVERERAHVPARVQLEDHRKVGLAVHARGTHVEPRHGGAPVRRQLQVADPAPDQARVVEPDAVGVALRVDRIELGAHDARQDEHAAELPPARAARRGAAGAVEGIRAELLEQQFLLAPVDVEQHAADPVDVALVESRLNLVESRCLVAVHAVGHFRLKASSCTGFVVRATRILKVLCNGRVKRTTLAPPSPR